MNQIFKESFSPLLKKGEYVASREEQRSEAFGGKVS